MGLGSFGWEVARYLFARRMEKPAFHSTPLFIFTDPKFWRPPCTSPDTSTAADHTSRQSIFDHYRQCNGLYINGEAVFGWDVKLDTPLESFTRHASGTSAARNRVFRLVHSRTLEEQPFGPFSQPVAAFGNPEIDNDNCYRGFRDAAATILRDRIAHTVDPSHLLEPTPTPNHVEEATGQPLRSLFLSIDQYPDLSLESDTFSSALN